MRKHLENPAGNALRRRREDAHSDEAHMRHRGIGDQFLHVLLHEGNERGVDHRDDREREDERSEFMRRHGEHW